MPERYAARPPRDDPVPDARHPLSSVADARPGLRRQGMRLPVPPGDLRPVVRAGHARDAVLHRLPEAHRPPLRGRRRRDGRAREGRGPARLRRRGDARRARRRGRARVAGRRGVDRLGAARVRAGRPRGSVHGRSRRPTTPIEHPRLRRRRGAGDARQRGRRPAAVQLHPPGDRPDRSAGDRDLDRGRFARPGQAHEAGDLRALRRAVRPPGGDAQRRPRLGEGDAADLPGAQGLLRGDRQRPARPDRAGARRRRGCRARADRRGQARARAVRDRATRARRRPSSWSASSAATGSGWPSPTSRFTLDAGATLVVFGPNGAGKSTLLRVLADAAAPARRRRSACSASRCPTRTGRCAGGSACSATTRCSTGT